MTTLVAFGDSIANGMGCRGNSYARLLAGDLGADYVDLTATSAQLSDTVRTRGQADGADVAIIAFGITEAMIRPTQGSLRLMPRRWRNPGWMDPRPYYSSTLRKRLPQRFESGLRWRVKSALIRASGGMRWGEPESYENELRELVAYLRSKGTERVLIVGRFGHDERFFPGSGASCEEFRAANQRVAESSGAFFCDGRGICREWDDFLLDHFHPSISGHRRIAGWLAAQLT